MRRIVVVGGSIAAVTAAQSLRTEGFDGQVTVHREQRRHHRRAPVMSAAHLPRARSGEERCLEAGHRLVTGKFIARSDRCR
ncbi:hypothetical protein P1P75_09440 [Streptomyces sp. ID05-39B]|uniref:hypothetical protein n=1 Tax=Streptomyces sp. ID05-39B TaxID=3028664 RepID=UPI0029B3C713|nr:hypothetical protein [Streptomyces sp. ID05-39B]MDX3526658.1 hypothetical protein [Streptomyces sp. ID05-39B]